MEKDAIKSCISLCFSPIERDYSAFQGIQKGWRSQGDLKKRDARGSAENKQACTMIAKDGVRTVSIRGSGVIAKQA